MDVSPRFSSGNSHLYKIQLKSNCRVKIYFWFCNSIIDNTDRIETPLISLSTVWPCFSLLFCSSKQWRCACLSLAILCFFRELCYSLPEIQVSLRLSIYNVSYSSVPISFLTEVLIIVLAIIFHTSLFCILVQYLSPLLEIKHHVIKNFCQFCLLR